VCVKSRKDGRPYNRTEFVAQRYEAMQGGRTNVEGLYITGCARRGEHFAMTVVSGGNVFDYRELRRSDAAAWLALRTHLAEQSGWADEQQLALERALTLAQVVEDIGDAPKLTRVVGFICLIASHPIASLH
jgi:hypothetical protein